MHIAQSSPFLIRLQIHRAELATPCTRNYTSRVRWRQRQVFSWASALDQQTLETTLVGILPGWHGDIAAEPTETRLAAQSTGHIGRELIYRARVFLNTLLGL
jgi:hypothetical protein